MPPTSQQGSSALACSCPPGSHHTIDPESLQGLTKAEWKKLSEGVNVLTIPGYYPCLYHLIECFEATGEPQFMDKIREGLKLAKEESDWRLDGHTFIKSEDVVWAKFCHGKELYTDEEAAEFRAVALTIGAPENINDYVHTCGDFGAHTQWLYRAFRLPANKLTVDRIKFIKMGLVNSGVYVKMELARHFLYWAVHVVLDMEGTYESQLPQQIAVDGIEIVYAMGQGMRPEIAMKASLATQKHQSDYRDTLKRYEKCLANFEQMSRQIQDDAAKGVTREGQSEAYRKLAKILLDKGYENFKKDSRLWLVEHYKDECKLMIVKTKAEKRALLGEAKSISMSDVFEALKLAEMHGLEWFFKPLEKWGIPMDVLRDLRRSLHGAFGMENDKIYDAVEAYGLVVVNEDLAQSGEVDDNDGEVDDSDGEDSEQWVDVDTYDDGGLAERIARVIKAGTDAQPRTNL